MIEPSEYTVAGSAATRVLGKGLAQDNLLEASSLLAGVALKVLIGV